MNVRFTIKILTWNILLVLSGHESECSYAMLVRILIFKVNHKKACMKYCMKFNLLCNKLRLLTI